MKSEDLNQLQTKIKLNEETTALCLGLTVAQYKRYLSGEPIPSVVKRAAFELSQIGETFL